MQDGSPRHLGGALAGARQVRPADALTVSARGEQMQNGEQAQHLLDGIRGAVRGTNGIFACSHKQLFDNEHAIPARAAWIVPMALLFHVN
jgi:hypothetical protein